LMDQSIPQLKVLGPVAAPLSKRRGHFRAQLLLSSTGRSFLHQAIRPVVRELGKKPSARQVRWSIDVDPMDLL
jgi:primosomal protein N' (replication factor Y) (superfamily II helicase)